MREGSLLWDVRAELARQARHTDWRDAQVTRPRDLLLKRPVWMEESVRRIDR